MRSKRIAGCLAALIMGVSMCPSVAMAVGNTGVVVEETENTSAETEEADEGTAAETETTVDAASMEELLSILSDYGVSVTVTDGEDSDGTESAATMVGIVDTDGGSLNVRIGASLDSDAFTQLADGTQVEVVSTDGEWVQIVLPECNGYVSADYLSIVEVAAESTEEEGLSLALSEDTISLLLQMFAEGSYDTEDAGLTPDGNLSLVDDIGNTESGKQFITLVTKNGNYFYLIIDRDDDGNETVHFLNQVDESDLLALMDEEEVAAYEEAAAAQIEEAAEQEAVEAETETEAVTEEPETTKSGNLMPAAILFLALLGGGGAFAWMKLKDKKKAVQEKPDPDADYEEETDDYEYPDEAGEDDDTEYYDDLNEEEEDYGYDPEDDEPV
ncbi:MAG: DUF4366 domain-containing protein [Lachnospiraceae bacterium]|nr:DUF4366 domain-containing protein [Lachnospiraceae bacterium]